jgi:hypothetical protein
MVSHGNPMHNEALIKSTFGLAIGWLVAITGAAALVFRRLAAPTRA